MSTECNWRELYRAASALSMDKIVGMYLQSFKEIEYSKLEGQLVIYKRMVFCKSQFK
jgi:hypothetical protein